MKIDIFRYLGQNNKRWRLRVARENQDAGLDHNFCHGMHRYSEYESVKQPIQKSHRCSKAR
jgi:hypothetical protein